jgi:AraC family transcriptional regulator of adaptative response/methylated-DNA-[protein]-cysteine methyltransferase
MNEQQQHNYGRIASAIEYINSNFRNQPTLEEIANEVHLSPFHFQRLFTEWAGVSPKKFLQYISVEYAKGILKESSSSVFEAAFETGLSGTGRLHDLFVSIEGMTPGEYKNGGETLKINYTYSDSPFGKILVASTSKGICHLAFADDEENAIRLLKIKFPNANMEPGTDDLQQAALLIFKDDWSNIEKIKLHLRGTPFQLKVWEALLKIPMGWLSTYGQIARHLQSPGSSRAVGTAIGDNPVAFLIPCHRVIQSSGSIGGYHWGPGRKKAMIGWEAAKNLYE